MTIQVSKFSTVTRPRISAIWGFPCLIFLMFFIDFILVLSKSYQNSLELVLSFIIVQHLYFRAHTGAKHTAQGTNYSVNALKYKWVLYHKGKDQLLGFFHQFYPGFIQIISEFLRIVPFFYYCTTQGQAHCTGHKLQRKWPPSSWWMWPFSKVNVMTHLHTQLDFLATTTMARWVPSRLQGAQEF